MFAVPSEDLYPPIGGMGVRVPPGIAVLVQSCELIVNLLITLIFVSEALASLMKNNKR